MIKQQLSQSLLQKLSPQQIQLMKLLQVPTAILDQRIQEEIESNPALEEGNERDEEYDSDIKESVNDPDHEFDLSEKEQYEKESQDELMNSIVLTTI